MNEFPLLTRSAQQLTRDETLEILKGEVRGVLSVVGVNGYPYGMPMNHYYHEADGCLYFHCGRGGHRMAALQRCDKASFCVYDSGTRAEGEWALRFRCAILFGRIEVLEDPALIADITARLSRRFTQDEAYIGEEIATYAAQTVLLRMTPEHICGKRVKEC